MLISLMVSVSLVTKQATIAKPFLLANFVGKALSPERTAVEYNLLSRFIQDSFKLASSPILGGIARVWRLGDRLIVIEEHNTMMVPGASSASVYAFDLQSRPLSVQSFDIGWRTYFERSAATTLPGTSIPVLKISTRGSAFGCFEYYAWTSNRLSLVHLCDAKGEPIKTNYGSFNMTIGPRPKLRSKAKLLEVLRGLDVAAQLETMVWLNGLHSNRTPPSWRSELPPKDLPVAVQEPGRENSAYWESTLDADVYDAIVRLQRSPFRWVKEEARRFVASHVRPKYPVSESSTNDW